MKTNETLCVGDGGKGRGERKFGESERERTSEKIHRTKSKRRYEE